MRWCWHRRAFPRYVPPPLVIFSLVRFCLGWKGIRIPCFPWKQPFFNLWLSKGSMLLIMHFSSGRAPTDGCQQAPASGCSGRWRGRGRFWWPYGATRRLQAQVVIKEQQLSCLSPQQTFPAAALVRQSQLVQAGLVHIAWTALIDIVASFSISDTSLRFSSIVPGPAVAIQGHRLYSNDVNPVALGSWGRFLHYVEHGFSGGDKTAKRISDRPEQI